MKSSIIFLIILTIILFTGCTEKLDTNYKGKSDNNLVIAGEISTDTTAHVVKLSRTVDYNATESQVETGAVVSITDGEQTFPLTESKPGYYQTEPTVYGVEGKIYTLTINTLDGKTYTASSKINRLTEIDSIYVKYELFPFNQKYYYKIFFNGQDPVGKGDNYIWNVYVDNVKFTDTLSSWSFQTDDFVDGQYVTNMDICWIEPIDIPNDTTLFTVEMVSIPKDYYTFISDVLSETAWRGGPFDPTPANVSTNIVGEGAVGFFVATQKKRKSMIYIKPEITGNK